MQLVDDSGGNSFDYQIKAQLEESLSPYKDALDDAQNTYQRYVKEKRLFLTLSIAFILLGVSLNVYLIHDNFDLIALVNAKSLFSLPLYGFGIYLFKQYKLSESDCEKYHACFVTQREQYNKADILYRNRYDPLFAKSALLVLYPKITAVKNQNFVKKTQLGVSDNGKKIIKKRSGVVRKISPRNPPPPPPT